MGDKASSVEHPVVSNCVLSERRVRYEDSIEILRAACDPVAGALNLMSFDMLMELSP